MNSIELTGIDWLGRGWPLVLAFTAATLLVAALRRPCRHLFGTERAFQLWLLPPLAMLASQLPHGVAKGPAALPTIMYTITAVTTALPVHGATANVVDWRTWALLVWLAGTVACLLLAAGAQSRYCRRLRSATPFDGLTLRWPVLRASVTNVGPALVGAFRSKIVLPVDFEQRYDTTEQKLVLFHEATHARRLDGCWGLLGQVAAATFWFNPLAWWALAALRHDQELACDAAVLREYGEHRRSYANAMLKTQSAAFALPVGCPWSPRHPVTERIAMLKRKQPRTMRRLVGGAAILLIAVGIASVVYAAIPAQQGASVMSHADRHTLKLELAVDGKPARLHATVCLKPDQYYQLTETDIGQLPPWHGRFTVGPAEKGELEVRGELSGGSLAAPSYPKLRMLPGQKGTIQIGQQVHDKQGHVTEDHTIKIDVTPSIGC
ncbi:M56 family metallopeptidase [Rhodanobacter sp. B05]|uniref:M56 family metallopeptidase n=1 Tax=Rhodanobacter sp. B05 TaxID=1945859 RepID=UPI000986AF89|nr:M56 family metallopeptidase [Rhodanobacter sp. B05]